MVLKDSIGNLRKTCEKGAVTEQSSNSEGRHNVAQTGRNINKNRGRSPRERTDEGG